MIIQNHCLPVFFTVFGSIETKKFRIIRQKKQYLNAYTGRRWLVLLAEVSSFATRINLYCQHNDSVAGNITQCERVTTVFSFAFFFAREINARLDKIDGSSCAC